MMEIIRKKGKRYVRICPLNPWIAFILSFLIPWFLPGIILAANYDTMGKEKERNIFIVIWILIFFVGSAVMGLTIGSLGVKESTNFIFYVWSLTIALLFSLIQLPDYKKWQKNKLKEGLKENINKEKTHTGMIKKIKLMYISTWCLLAMTLVVFPLVVNYLFNRSSFFEKGEFFNEIQGNVIFIHAMGLIFIIAISSIFLFWWTIKKYTVPKDNTLDLFQLATMLYSMGVLPAGFGLIIAVCLIISNFSIFGISSKILLWIVILIFGAMSIYGLHSGNKLLNQKLIYREHKKNE